jgi:hypothetical protein
MARKSLKIIFFLFLKKNHQAMKNLPPRKKKEKTKGPASRHKLQHIQFAIQI